MLCSSKLKKHGKSQFPIILISTGICYCTKKNTFKKYDFDSKLYSTVFYQYPWIFSLLRSPSIGRKKAEVYKWNLAYVWEYML